MKKRSAVAAWAGDLKDGTGTVSCESGVLSNVRYGYKARFEDGPGANPEELIAAALATCFSMAMSAELDDLRLVPKSLRVAASITLERAIDGYSISDVHLELTARVPGLDERSLEAVVSRAKAACPVARLIGAPITLKATLEA